MKRGDTVKTTEPIYVGAGPTPDPKMWVEAGEVGTIRTVFHDGYFEIRIARRLACLREFRGLLYAKADQIELV